MWNLSQIRTRLQERLAEESSVFWSVAERDSAVNEAQRFISSVTKGVPSFASDFVSTTAPYVAFTGKLVGEYVSAGWVVNGGVQALNNVRVDQANMTFPEWTQAVGTPRWAILIPDEQRVYISPTPATPIEVSVKVSVLPDDLTDTTDELFNGEPIMEKYQGALLNIAAALLLLKERYDGDAERFYQFAIQEMQSLGVNPTEIPPLPRQAVQDG
jgi:hypothetical protein